MTQQAQALEFPVVLNGPFVTLYERLEQVYLYLPLETMLEEAIRIMYLGRCNELDGGTICVQVRFDSAQPVSLAERAFMLCQETPPSTKEVKLRIIVLKKSNFADFIAWYCNEQGEDEGTLIRQALAFLGAATLPDSEGRSPVPVMQYPKDGHVAEVDLFDYLDCLAS